MAPVPASVRILCASDGVFQWLLVAVLRAIFTFFIHKAGAFEGPTPPSKIRAGTNCERVLVKWTYDCNA